MRSLILQTLAQGMLACEITDPTKLAEGVLACEITDPINTQSSNSIGQKTLCLMFSLVPYNGCKDWKGFGCAGSSAHLMPRPA